MKTLYLKEMRALARPMGAAFLVALFLAAVVERGKWIENLGLFLATGSVIAASLVWTREGAAIRFLLTRPVAPRLVALAKFLAFLTCFAAPAALFLLHAATRPADAFTVASTSAAAALFFGAFAWHDCRRRAVGEIFPENGLDRFIHIAVLFIVGIGLPLLALGLSGRIDPSRLEPLVRPAVHWSLALAALALVLAAALLPPPAIPRTVTRDDSPFARIVRRELHAMRHSILFLALAGPCFHILLAFSTHSVARSAVAILGPPLIAALFLPLNAFHGHLAERGSGLDFLFVRPVPRRTILLAFGVAGFLPVAGFALFAFPYLLVFDGPTTFLVGYYLFLAAGAAGAFWLGLAALARRDGMLGLPERALAAVTAAILLSPFLLRFLAPVEPTAGEAGCFLILLLATYVAGSARLLNRLA